MNITTINNVNQIQQLTCRVYLSQLIINKIVKIIEIKQNIIAVVINRCQDGRGETDVVAEGEGRGRSAHVPM